MPWLDTLAAIHRSPAMRPRSSDFSKSVEVARSAARQAGPSAPSPNPPKVTGRRALSWREEWQGLLHEVQRVLLSRDVPAPPALAWAPPQGGPCVERALHRAQPGRAAAGFPDGLVENMGDVRGIW